VRQCARSTRAIGFCFIADSSRVQLPGDTPDACMMHTGPQAVMVEWRSCYIIAALALSSITTFGLSSWSQQMLILERDAQPQ